MDDVIVLTEIGIEPLEMLCHTCAWMNDDVQKSYVLLTILARIDILLNILYIRYESIVGTARGTSTLILTWLKIKLSRSVNVLLVFANSKNR